MGTGHGHDHTSMTAGAANRGKLVAVLLMMLGVAAVQVVGALTTGSLALFADAGHTLTDSLGVGLALGAVWMAMRPPDTTRTFGLQRAEVLAAAVNALVLFGLCAFVTVEAIERIYDPQPVAGAGMVLVAAIGLVVNIAAMFLLRSGQRESLNVRGAYLEVLGDALASAGVIVGGLVIWATDWQRADSLISLAIAAFILPRAWSLLREAVHVLLEAVPRGVDLSEVRTHILRQPGVLDVHDLHAWTITSGLPVMSAHVVVEEERLADTGRMLDELHACLSGHFDVEHSTLQLEPAGHYEHEGAQHH